MKQWAYDMGAEYADIVLTESAAESSRVYREVMRGYFTALKGGN